MLPVGGWVLDIPRSRGGGRGGGGPGGGFGGGSSGGASGGSGSRSSTDYHRPVKRNNFLRFFLPGGDSLWLALSPTRLTNQQKSVLQAHSRGHHRHRGHPTNKGVISILLQREDSRRLGVGPLLDM